MANIAIVSKHFFDFFVSSYDPKTNDWLMKLSSIVTHQNNNEIEKKLWNALRLLGVATSIDYPDVKFTLLASALEALVMTGSDKDNIGYKLAERIAFLIAIPDQRLKSIIKDLVSSTKMKNKK